MPDGARRWPVHPEPAPGEALTSWLGRLAGLYRLSVEQLLTYNLGPASAQFDVVRPRDAALDYQVPAFDVVRPREADLDYQAPAAVLRALTARTGIAVGRLRRMTISGCVPWLADTLDPADGQKAFSAYVRQDSVVLPPGRAGYHVVNHWVPWLPARSRPWRTARRVCPTCPADRGILLLAALPLMISCAEHGCRLERVHEVRRAHRYGEPMTPRPVPDAVAALDRLTFEGIATGSVTLPSRTVHVGEWLRLLRTLLDEVSMVASRAGPGSATMLHQIWDTADLPFRAGLILWRPYERLSPAHQEAMLHAAATAVQLAADGRIIPGGTLGAALQPASHRR
ncbi:TniQ family protein [Nonomuraea sp. NPDC050643]|uniref:TniQ family protein n=1 Tax=Nonomuraea sp. NPDC050643 TaxID=3155660 RepID=UPI0033C95CF8